MPSKRLTTKTPVSHTRRMIGDVLRKWRRAEDIGVREAAKQMGITHGTLSRVERGFPMDGETLIKILQWLFGGTKCPKGKA